MSEDNNADDGGLEAGLRWIAEQVSQTVQHLEDLDLDKLVQAAGVDAERAREFLDHAEQWLTDQADNLTGEAGLRFSGLADIVAKAAKGAATPSSGGPHPLDQPTDAQGVALSAIDSGRWTVEAGSAKITTTGEGPAPTDALGLVGELRARDWISADGTVTLVGHNALKRWMSQTDAG